MIKTTETKLRVILHWNPDSIKMKWAHFFESFNHKTFRKAIGNEVNFFQDNQSRSRKRVLWGLRFQKRAHVQIKLISVIEGKIRDVVVDLRKVSPTLKQWLSQLMDIETKHQLFILRGFVHGFLTLNETAIVLYKCDNYINNVAKGCIRYDDSLLNFRLGSRFIKK